MTGADPGDGLPAGVTSASNSRGPTVRRMVLGAQMRRLRQTSQISPEAAGYAMRASGSKISRMELGARVVQGTGYRRPPHAVRG